MKKLLVLIAIAIVGFLIYQRLGAPSSPGGPEQVQLRQLEDELRSAREQIGRAGRASALSGVDTTADAGDAAARIHRIDEKLARLERETSSEDVRERAGELRQEIDTLGVD